jgi:hypothetical protein
MIQSQCFLDPLNPHHLEAHGIGEAEPMITIRTQPTVRRSRLKIASRSDDCVHRVSVHCVQELAPRIGSAFANDQNMHLGYDQIRRDERCSSRNKVIVNCR